MKKLINAVTCNDPIINLYLKKIKNKCKKNNFVKIKINKK